MTILKSKSLAYSDVNLVAQPQSLITSRSEIPRELHRIFVSPMSSVVGKEFAIEANNLGLSVCMHRFGLPNSQLDIFDSCPHPNRMWFSVGLSDGLALEDILYNVEHPNILIDVANGYLKGVEYFAAALHERGCQVMAGNIHTGEGVRLFRNPCFLRVGIGGGSVCKTSTVTGYTRGQITELEECAEQAKESNINIIADGGIAGPGEALKAFGCGCYGVMMGGYFSLASESANCIDGVYKYWGGASEFQKNLYGAKKTHIEGRVEENSPQEYLPLSTLVERLWEGISSGISYSGFGSLTDFIGNGVFEIKA